MRLKITRKSSSLYSKDLIAIGEQDQKMGPWFTTSGLGGDSCSKMTSVSWGNQELNKTQTLRRVTAVIYRVLDVTPLDAPPNGPKHDTRSNGPKDGVAVPWQILDADLFWWFPLVLKVFWRETTWIGFLIKLSFQPYVDHRKWSPNVSWVTSLRQTSLGTRDRLQLQLNWASTMKKMNWTPMLDLLLYLACMWWSSDVLINIGGNRLLY